MFAYLSQSADDQGGFAIVTDRFLCLLGHSATAVQASELYAALDSEAVHLNSALSAMIAHYSLTDFAIVEVLDAAKRRMTVAVQGDVVADVDGATGTRLSGPTGATWVMGEVRGVTALSLSLTGAPDALDDERLPLRRGVVRAAVVALNPSTEPAPALAFIDEPSPKTVQMELPRDPRVVSQKSSAAPRGKKSRKKTPSAKPPVETVPAGKAPDAKAPVEKMPDAKAPVEKMPVEKTPVAKAPVEVAPSEAVPAETESAGEAPTKEEPSEKRPHEQAPREVVPRVVRATPARVTPEEIPPESRAERGATRIDLSAEVAGGRLGVQLLDGNPFAANIPLVLGRRPWSTELDTSSIVSIALESPMREISAIHLEIAEIGGRLKARDLNSTNGTVIMTPGRPSWLLDHGRETILERGDVLDLGEGALVKIVGLDDSVYHR